MKKNKINWWYNFINVNSKKKLSRFILNNNNFNEGKNTKIFEKRLCKILGAKYGLCTTSGTSALMLSLFTLGVRPGDEIIIPNRGWIATAHAAYVLGAKIVLVDTHKDQNINEAKIFEKISKRTKVIIPVHVNGHACEILKIKKIAKKHKLKLVEDSCQAFMSKYKEDFLGTFGDMGCYSFGSTKLLNNIQGGFVVTNNKNIFNNLKLIKNHGVFNNFTDQWNQPGFNFKYNEIQSKIGIENLRFVEKKIKKLKLIDRLYRQKIDNENITFLNHEFGREEVPLYTLIHSKKRGLIKFMKKFNIQIRPLPPSISMSPYIKNKTNDFQKNNKFFENCYYLPSGPDLNIKDLNQVCNSINNFK